MIEKSVEFIIELLDSILFVVLNIGNIVDFFLLMRDKVEIGF